VAWRRHQYQLALKHIAAQLSILGGMQRIIQHAAGEKLAYQLVESIKPKAGAGFSISGGFSVMAAAASQPYRAASAKPRQCMAAIRRKPSAKRRGLAAALHVLQKYAGISACWPVRILCLSFYSPRWQAEAMKAGQPAELASSASEAVAWLARSRKSHLCSWPGWLAGL